MKKDVVVIDCGFNVSVELSTDNIGMRQAQIINKELDR